ncbi:MAG: hydrogenase expression/formation protein HypE [Candidatus Omnitrophota bacterium]|nr:MAG: hydrogenase expression/formation protein HypE [Candidatus Omnitrophota bacterium]
MRERISLKHGEGMRASFELINEVFLKRISRPPLGELLDAAHIGSYVFSCDSFTVKPIFFPSSDIGKLSIFGTVNDICVSAGSPLYLSVAVIVEEGFFRRDLERIAQSIGQASRKAEVEVVGGDFKVVEKGKIDKIFISTSGIGKRITNKSPSFKHIKDKDKIILTGAIGEHGISVMLSRKKIFDFRIESDCQSLKDILIPLWKEFSSVHFMRDPTRGGIAATFNEIYLGSQRGIKIFEENIPLRKDVQAACDILGIDPYYLACEGRAVIVADKSSARDVLKFIKKKCPQAAIVGEVDSRLKGVVMETVSGGERILDFSHSFNLPRIC